MSAAGGGGGGGGASGRGFLAARRLYGLNDVKGWGLGGGGGWGEGEERGDVLFFDVVTIYYCY